MVKGAKTIAEYAIRKWMDEMGFAMEFFKLEMAEPHQAVIMDQNGDQMKVVYDPENRSVFPL